MSAYLATLRSSLCITPRSHLIGMTSTYVSGTEDSYQSSHPDVDALPSTVMSSSNVSSLSSSNDVPGDSRAVSLLYSRSDSPFAHTYTGSNRLSSLPASVDPRSRTFSSPSLRMQSNFAGSVPGSQPFYVPTTSPPPTSPTRVTQSYWSSETTEPTAPESVSSGRSAYDPLEHSPTPSPSLVNGVEGETWVKTSEGHSTAPNSVVTFDSYEQAPEVSELSGGEIGDTAGYRQDFHRLTGPGHPFGQAPSIAGVTARIPSSAPATTSRANISRYTSRMTKPLTAVSRFVTGRWARERGGSRSGSEGGTDTGGGEPTVWASRIADTWRR